MRIKTFGGFCILTRGWCWLPRDLMTCVPAGLQDPTAPWDSDMGTAVVLVMASWGVVI